MKVRVRIGEQIIEEERRKPCLDRVGRPLHIGDIVIVENAEDRYLGEWKVVKIEQKKMGCLVYIEKDYEIQAFYSWALRKVE